MAKDFGKHERRICSLFTPGTIFTYKGKTYSVVFSDKPVCRKGEPKTDIFIQARPHGSSGSAYINFKISYKQDNADFLENKTNAERAEQLLGTNWTSIIQQSTLALQSEFNNRPLIFTNSYRRTEAGSITLGWKFELLRVKSGDLSSEIVLTLQQKRDVYAGTNLSRDKKDATVNGQTIENSGIAEYIYEEITPAHSAQDVIDSMLTIDEFLSIYPNIYYACKALNYRSFHKKYDGNRPLSVFVDWGVIGNQLHPQLVFNKPLITKGNEVYEKLISSMNILGIDNTDAINENNISDVKFIWC